MLYILLTVSIFALFQGQAAGQALCGSNPPRRCLADDAFCNSRGKCECNPGLVGNGYLSCYAPGQEECHLWSDPVLSTFKSVEVNFPVPCRFHAARFVVRDESLGQDEWRCRTLVSGFNERVHGRVFARGFDVHIEYLHGTEGKKEFWIRALGVVTANGYEFEREVKTPDSAVWETFDDNSLLLSFLPHDHYITFSVDDVDKRLELDVDFCGLKVYFRPANPDEGIKQTRVPGLSLVVDDNNHDISWGPASRNSVCLDPVSSYGVANVSSLYQLDPEYAFIYSAFVNSDHQIFPGASEECMNVKAVAVGCTDVESRKEAFQMCTFVLDSPIFMNCWEGPSSSTDSYIILELFKVCLRSFCSKDVTDCTNLRNQLRDHKCKVKANQDLISHTCNFS